MTHKIEIAPQEERFLNSLRDTPYQYIANPLFENIVDLPRCRAEDLEIADSRINGFVIDPDDTFPAGQSVVLSKEEEHQLFFRYNWLRFRIAKMQKEWWESGKSELTDEETQSFLALFAEVERIEAQIDKINLGIKVLACKKAFKRDDESFMDFWSAANLSMIKAIRFFDVLCDTKFSTYYMNSAFRSMARDAERNRTFRDKYRSFSSMQDEDGYGVEHSIAQPEPDMYDGDQFLQIVSFINGETEVPKQIALTEFERQVISAKYFNGNQLRSEFATSINIMEILEKQFNRKITRQRVDQLLSDAHVKVVEFCQWLAQQKIIDECIQSIEPEPVF